MHLENKSLDHKPYMPILRCKEAEKKALTELDVPIRDRMTPLIEVPRALYVKTPDGKNRELLTRDDPRVPYVLDDWLRKTALDIQKAWYDRHSLLDLQHLHPEWRTPSGMHPVTACWNYANEHSLFPPNPVPIVTLSSDSDFCQAVQGVLRIENVGIGMRITREQLNDSNFQTHLAERLLQFQLSPAQVDLIVDFGIVGKDELDLAWMCSRVPWIQDWRTYSCIGGSFPKNLIGLSVGEHEFPRWEWRAYRNQITDGVALPRIPIFGDYATQYAEYCEPVPGARPSASIRYTAEDNFIVVKGQALHLGTRHLQYPANAMSLCSRPEFRTIATCAGDDYIEDKANRMLEIEQTGKGTGIPKTWLQASLNRHWTATGTQISELFAF